MSDWNVNELLRHARNLANDRDSWRILADSSRERAERAEAELMCREQEIKTLCELLERAQGWTDHWPDDLTEELRVTLEALRTRA